MRRTRSNTKQELVPLCTIGAIQIYFSYSCTFIYPISDPSRFLDLQICFNGFPSPKRLNTLPIHISNGHALRAFIRWARVLVKCSALSKQLYLNLIRIYWLKNQFREFPCSSEPKFIHTNALALRREEARETDLSASKSVST